MRKRDIWYDQWGSIRLWVWLVIMAIMAMAIWFNPLHTARLG